MKCPFCGEENTKVIDSRPAEEINSIRRRRQCEVCGKRFTTYEKVETIPLIVIKKDDNREPYDRSKIERGIVRSCHKRPVSYDQIVSTVEEIEAEIFNKEEKEALCDEISLARFGSAEEVAKLVLFLSNNDSSGYINGQIITIDGGMY